MGRGAYMGLKAELAQYLLDRSWEKTAQTGRPYLPWPGLDAHPIARLHVPAHNAKAVILNRDSGQALAFAPGLIGGTTLAREDGFSAIAAHKNTHFRFLKDASIGDDIYIDLPRSQPRSQVNSQTDSQSDSRGNIAAGRRHFRITHMEIIDSRKQGLAPGPEGTLALVTCYPFNALTFNGPLRFVVYAARV